jgi:hypothetical protein
VEQKLAPTGTEDESKSANKLVKTKTEALAEDNDDFAFSPAAVD